LRDFWSDQLKKDPLYLLDSPTRDWVTPLLQKLKRRFVLKDFESPESIMNKQYNDPSVGNEIWRLADRLFPIFRCLTGPGVRQTLSILNEQLDGQMKVYEVPGGTKGWAGTAP